MNENTFIDSFFIRFNLGLIVFVCCLHFYILSHFETIRCIAKSLIATSRDFCWNTTEKRKTEKHFWGVRGWAPKLIYQSGVEISFFCLTGHFCCWRNQIVVHLLQLRVLLMQYVPCFLHLSLEAFPISAIRKCLICRKSTFSHLFYSIFSLKIPSCILAPNTLEIQTRLRLTLSQSQHFKRLLNAITHKHSNI